MSKEDNTKVEKSSIFVLLTPKHYTYEMVI